VDSSYARIPGRGSGTQSGGVGFNHRHGIAHQQEKRMTNPLALTVVGNRPDARFEALRRLVVDGLQSPNSRKTYDMALRQFLAWFTMQQPGTLFNKATVQAYRLKLESAGLSAASINVKMAVIRRLAVEAIDNSLLAPDIGAGILRVKGAKRLGRRAGNWLSREDAKRLISVPDGPSTRPGQAATKGIRDRALLAVFLGCGLRRQEIVDLTFDKLAIRDGRWCIVDLVGKGGRVRTVVMPNWVKHSVDTWATAADLSAGIVFRSVNAKQRMDGEPLTPQSVFKAVKVCAARLGISIAPHDLRRTHAKLAFKGGVDLQQLQISLGHSSIKTTEVYTGCDQDLQAAPCDFLGIGGTSKPRTRRRK
jgi:site-specific recombinase XerD